MFKPVTQQNEPKIAFSTIVLIPIYLNAIFVTGSFYKFHMK